MKTPESVRYDAELDVFYVSNINGNPSGKDNNGYIAIIRADSIGVPAKMLVEGGKNGVTLNAPKGMALSGDTLWVADITFLRAFNRKTGAKLFEIDLGKHKATFLNDVAIGGEGDVYITHPGTDQIFRIDNGNWTTYRADSLNAPNGIAWDAGNQRFVLGGSGNAVQTWKSGDKAPATLVMGPGGYDGIEVLADGRILITSWTDSTVNVVKNGALTKLITGVNGPADIGFDTKRSVLAIPMLSDNKVVFYKMP